MMLSGKVQAFQSAKLILKSKNNQNSIKLWLNYYNWCLYYEKYEEAKKIIK